MYLICMQWYLSSHFMLFLFLLCIFCNFSFFFFFVLFCSLLFVVMFLLKFLASISFNDYGKEICKRAITNTMKQSQFIIFYAPTTTICIIPFEKLFKNCNQSIIPTTEECVRNTVHTLTSKYELI